MAKRRRRQSGEKCQRCGERGEDRRTLMHACFYAMDELPIPFKLAAIHGQDIEYERTETNRFGNGFPFRTHHFAKPDKDAEGYTHQFFTLRVCKDCRASWMGALESWFKNVVPQYRVTTLVNSGIFVRRRGSLVEISEDEWYKLNPGREPVRVVRR